MRPRPLPLTWDGGHTGLSTPAPRTPSSPWGHTRTPDWAGAHAHHSHNHPREIQAYVFLVLGTSGCSA